LMVPEGTFDLVFSDDGVGFADPMNISRIGSLGLQLVRDLIQQMSGTLHTQSGQGATFHITFPTSNNEQEMHR
jgi:two-component sensor histidine kinase